MTDQNALLTIHHSAIPPFVRDQLNETGFPYGLTGGTPNSWPVTTVSQAARDEAVHQLVGTGAISSQQADAATVVSFDDGVVTIAVPNEDGSLGLHQWNLKAPDPAIDGVVPDY